SMRASSDPPTAAAFVAAKTGETEKTRARRGSQARESEREVISIPPGNGIEVNSCENRARVYTRSGSGRYADRIALPARSNPWFRRKGTVLPCGRFALNITKRKVLVLGGYGLVGTAVCRELLERRPREIQIHSLRMEESEAAREELLPEAGETVLSVSAGDIFGLIGEPTTRERIRAQIVKLGDSDLGSFLLYKLITESKSEIVIDCVNTATGIAYRDI